MLRATKAFSSFLFAAIVFLGANQAQADEYELGPFTVTGFGITENLAEADAYGEAWDLVMDIVDGLPTGHVLVDFVVESGTLTSPNTYDLQFHVVIEFSQTGGGGGGGGTGGPGS